MPRVLGPAIAAVLAVAACLPTLDDITPFPCANDGTCPAGTHSGCTFNFGQCTPPASCCQYDPCTPPPPYCADKSPGGCVPDSNQPRICRMACA